MRAAKATVAARAWAPPRLTPHRTARARAQRRAAAAATALAACALLLPAGDRASAPSAAATAAATPGIPLFFERNAGQVADRGVEYVARAGDANLLLRPASATVAGATGRLTMRLRGADPHARMRATGALPGVVNYLHGSDRARWHTNVATSRGVEVRDAWPGIDVAWYGAGEHLEYDLVVAPGADPGRIAIDLRGAERVALADDGDLEITLTGGTVTRHEAPILYQRSGARRVAVDGAYELSGSTLRFRVGAYDHRRALTIDPLLYSTLTGGGVNNNVLAVDGDGNAYVAGNANALFTATAGAWQTSSGGGSTEAFVAKIDPRSSGAASLVYATYLGGSLNEIAGAIAVDGSGRAVLTGTTSSTNFPVTPGAFDTTAPGGSDVFVTKLDSSGGGLVYSTYLGGSAGEDMAGEVMGIALGPAGKVYVTGRTVSADFPVASPLQATIGGFTDAFVARLDTAAAGAASLEYATYLGGASNDAGLSIAVDGAGRMVVGGATEATGFPGVSASSIQPVYGGGATDGFLTQLSASGGQQLYATYLGGGNREQINALTIDAAGNAYVAGNTVSTNFPVTSGAFQVTRKGTSDAFVAKIAPDGTSTLWATYLGGTSTEGVYQSGAIEADPAGNVWLAGETLSADFPVVTPLQAAHNGITDVFVTKLSATGAGVLFSTLLGGSGADHGDGIELTGSGLVYVSGQASQPFQGNGASFPTTANASRRTTTLRDSFLSVISEPGEQADLSVTAIASPSPVVVGAPLTYRVTVRNDGPGAAAGIVVTDTLPAGVTFESAQAGPTGSCAPPSGATLRCDVVSLLAGASTTITVRVTAAAAGTLTNTAAVTSQTTDPHAANDTASVDVDATATSATDLSVTKTASAPSVVLGTSVTYTVRVRNEGPGAASAIVVTDALPAGVTFGSAQIAPTGSCGPPSGATLRCDVASLLPGESATIDVTVTPTAVGTITNTAAVTSQTPDPVAANDSASVDVEVTAPAAADLSITKVASAAQGVVGNALRYTLRVANAGPDTAFGVVVDDPLPAGMSLVAASSTQGTCSSAVSCALGTLASGADATIAIDVVPTAPGSATNTATVGSDTPDPDSSDDSATVTIPVIAATADLTLTGTDAPDPVVAGDRLTYALTVANAGPSPAGATSLTDELPAGTTLVSAQPSQGSCSGSATVTCALGTIAAGAHATVTLAVSAPPSPGTIANTASVTAAELDPTPAGNVATLETTVQQAPSDGLPRIVVNRSTLPMVNGAHTGYAVGSSCPTGRLVGGGAYLRNAANPATLPTNGLVLGGTGPSTGSSPVDLAVEDGAIDPSHWIAVANFTGASELGDQAQSFALCATSRDPSHTVVETASTVGVNAAQQVDPPNVTTATCAPGTRLVGGGAVTSTPDQVNDGTTFGNAGNLKPLASYPSDAAGVPAADGSTDATSWSAHGSAGIPSTVDKVTAYALCSTDASTPPARVVRVDVASTASSPVTVASPSCPAATRLIGGGFKVDQTVGVRSGLQPQQGYHMRGSYPSSGAGSLPVEVADGTSNPSAWTSLLQAGGQVLSGTSHMDLHAFAMCATPPPPSLPPAVTTGAASAIANTGASLAGTIDPNGPLTAYTFEYGTTLAFGAITPPDYAGDGTAPLPVSATLTGLEASTTYYYRLVATSSVGTSMGTVRSFRTAGPARAPVAITGAASAVGATSATLAGQVNPRGQQTAYTIEYGASLSFGAITPVVALDDADALEPVSETLTGLAPNTTYYYRVVATNATATAIGEVAGFTTASGAR